MLESDWKLFRKRLPDWQERFMEKLLEEYRAIIDSGGFPSARYHELQRRIKEDSRCPGVFLDIGRRSEFGLNLRILLKEKVISDEDLQGFSDELLEFLKK